MEAKVLQGWYGRLYLKLKMTSKEYIEWKETLIQDAKENVEIIVVCDKKAISEFISYYDANKILNPMGLEVMTRTDKFGIKPFIRNLK